VKLQPAHRILRAAASGRYCVGAFNCTSPVQVKAVVDAAAALDAPVMVQTSVTPASWFGPAFWVGVVSSLADAVDVPVILHLDHCDDEAFCREAARAGYTNIMIDASHQPIDDNIAAVRRVVAFCHEHGASVEGELGTVSGVEDQVVVAADDAQLADPEQAIRFVEETRVDLFAPAIGTAHGVYQTADPVIDVDRFARINQMINGDGVVSPLVVHGGTGLQEDMVRRLVAAGGAKYNVSTDLKHHLVDASWDYLSQHRDDYNPGKLDKAVYQATLDRVQYWIRLLGSAGKANDFHDIPEPERAHA
jgi:ketose-bisphosphate aldolase